MSSHHPQRLACFALVVYLLNGGVQQCGHSKPAANDHQNKQVSIRATDTRLANCTDDPPQASYGITIEDTEDPALILPNLRKIRDATHSRVAVRIVIDPDHDLNDETYKNGIEAIKREGFLIMALLADSHDIHRFRSNSRFDATDVSKYKGRIEKALMKFGSSIDVWEIGNEINGEWSGWMEKENQNATQDWEKAGAEKRAKSRQWVYNQVKAAYDVLQPADKCMAITFYYNDNQNGDHCWPQDLDDGSKYEMLNWVTEHFTDKEIRDHIKYVFISYYENTECRKLLSGNSDTDAARFSNILKQLSKTFEKADVGFGEFGPECEYEEGCFYSDERKRNRLCERCTNDIKDLIPRYYKTYHDKMITIGTPRFVGGYFYWFGLQDMVTHDSPAMTELTKAISGR
jgi:hypothetical protein